MRKTQALRSNLARSCAGEDESHLPKGDYGMRTIDNVVADIVHEPQQALPILSGLMDYIVRRQDHALAARILYAAIDQARRQEDVPHKQRTRSMSYEKYTV
jgi:hypothetical protein